MHNQNESRDAILKLLSDVELVLKLSTTGNELALRGINSTVALVALQGVAAYIDGHRTLAVEDLITAAEEISGLGPGAKKSDSGMSK